MTPPSSRAGVAVALAAAALVGCAGVPPSPLRQDAAAEMIAADQAFSDACSRHDADAFGGFVAEDAVFLGRRGLLRGRAGVLEGWNPLLAGGGPVLQWWPLRADASSSGELGFTTGTWRLEEPEGEVSTGEYVTVWRRDADGSYRALFDGPLQEVGRDPAPRALVRDVRSEAGDLAAEVGTIGTATGQGAGTLYLTVSRPRDGAWSPIVETTVQVSGADSP